MKKEWFAASMVFLCMGAGAFAADGFGQKATGGAGGQVVAVTDAAAFKKYVEAAGVPYIVQVSESIDLTAIGGRVRIQSDKTIQGVGEKPTIIGELGFRNGSSNVIIERLNMTNPNGTGEGDGLNIKEDITNVFVTHCTFYDCDDGCLDITRRSDQITVSWCKFYFTQPKPQNNRVTLIGSSDGASDDEGKLHITLHHNWYGPNCWQRIPSVRFGRIHLYNNYYDCSGNLYGIWSRIKAECLIENNVFKGIAEPYAVHVADEPTEARGKICARGNVLENCAVQADAGKDTVFTPPYTYTPDDAAKVAQIIQSGAGADGAESPAEPTKQPEAKAQTSTAN